MSAPAATVDGGPLVTVAVPAFNAATTIERTLNSIAAQTHANFEAIVVDDGSTDATAELAADVAARDRRFRLVRQANGGVASARNRALKEARGTYFAPIDADDVWAPENIARQVEALERSGADFSFARSFIIDEHDRRRDRPVQGPLPSDYVSLLRRNWVGNGSAAVFRRAALLAINGYDEALRAQDAQGAEDWKVVLQLAAQRPGVAVEHALIGYRQVGDSMSGNLDSMSRSALLVIDEMRRKGPRVAPWNFWHARSTIHIWMFYPWAYAGRWGKATGALASAYLFNPLWFTQRSMRDFLFRELAPHALKRVSMRFLPSRS